MRALVGLVTLVLIFGIAAMAEDNSVAGTWKLNAKKSTLNGVVPAFVHDGIMTIPNGVFTGAPGSGRMDRGVRSGTTTPVFKFDLSADQRTLTLTRPGSEPSLKIVFDRQ